MGSFPLWLKRYPGFLRSSPFLSRSLTSCFMIGVADYLSQRIIKEPDEPTSIKSVVASGLWGFFFNAPSMTLWHVYLVPKILNRVKLPGHVLPILFISALDALGNSWIQPTTYILVSDTLRHDEMHPMEAWEKSKRLVPCLFLNSIMAWIPYNILMFTCCPVIYRPLAVNCMNFTRHLAMAYLVHRGKADYRFKQDAMENFDI